MNDTTTISTDVLSTVVAYGMHKCMDSGASVEQLRSMLVATRIPDERERWAALARLLAMWCQGEVNKRTAVWGTANDAAKGHD